MVLDQGRVGIEGRPRVLVYVARAARDAAAKHKAEADARIKYILRKDKLSTQTRVKGIKERIDQLRQDFSDIVTEEELSGYEAILTKTIEEAKEDPEA